jgi:MYXO-CTERM domain-containing protein
MANSGDDGALDSFLDEWVTLAPGCTPENEFCDNAGGLAIVEKEPTRPYLPEWMICSAHPATGSPVALWLPVAIVLGTVLRRRRRRSA